MIIKIILILLVLLSNGMSLTCSNGEVLITVILGERVVEYCGTRSISNPGTNSDSTAPAAGDGI